MSTDKLLNHDQPSSTTGTTGDTMTRAMALNLANWTDSSVKARGVETATTESLWWRQPGDAPIYLTALIFNAQTSDDELFSEVKLVEDAWGTRDFDLWDCCGAHDLSKGGFEQVWKNPWYLRPASAIAAAALPEGLFIEIVASADQLAEFEWASWVGFEEPEEAPEVVFRDRKRYAWHALSTLDDPGMYYLIARLNGQVVAGVIAHVTEDMVGIYGLSTLPEFRRRGYATALVHASVALRPDLSVCVQPDPPTVSIYTSMGFVRGGEIASWRKAA